VLALALLACGCSSEPQATGQRFASGASGANGASDSSVTSSPSAPSRTGASTQGLRLAPLAAESWLISLPLEGFGDFFVTPPLGATEARPVVVALHGIQDRAEWACGEWRGAAGPLPFVLCPRGVPSAGVPRSAGVFAHAGAAQTRREIDAGLRALRNRFGAHVAEGPSILVGFSLGANVGARIALDEPRAFPRLVLVEGSNAAWTPASALAFAKAGGQRVLFGCSQGGCRQTVKGPMAALRAAGVGSELADAGNIGHLVDQRMINAVRARWPFLVAGDERYAAPLENVAP
jgi:pimeloyl-ACP methyl ester carboxylesterase